MKGIQEHGLKRLAQLYNEEDVEAPDDIALSATEFGQALAGEYGIQLYLGDNGEGITISKIVVPEDQQNQGIGSQVMQEIVDYADSRGMPIALTPDDTYGGSVNRLEQFYRGFGFVPNKGRNKDYSFMETLIRPAN